MNSVNEITRIHLEEWALQIPIPFMAVSSFIYFSFNYFNFNYFAFKIPFKITKTTMKIDMPNKATMLLVALGAVALYELIRRKLSKYNF